MADTPTPHDLQRQVDQLTVVVNRDRDELRTELRDGFADLKVAISGLDFVSKEVHALAQARLEQEIKALERMVVSQGKELSTLRRLIISSLVTILVAGGGAIALDLPV